MTKKNKRFDFWEIGFFIFVSFIVFFAVWAMIDEKKKLDNCSDVFPPIIGKYRSAFPFEKMNHFSVVGIEEGYIKCCRGYYENHILKTECGVFKYD